MKIYLIGSLRNPQIPAIAARFRQVGFDVFDDWFAAGPNADDHWRDYERGRGHSFAEALNCYAAGHVFAFDLFHLTQADAVVLISPAGKSAHLELGWALGRGKHGYIVCADPERYDIMYKFATGVCADVGSCIDAIRKDLGCQNSKLQPPSPPSSNCPRC